MGGKSTMYTMVLMMSMGSSADVADFGGRRGGCNGNVAYSSGCYGSGYGYSGGCWGSGSGCHGRDRGGFLGLRDRGGCHGRDRGGFLGHRDGRGCHGGSSCHGYGAGYGGGCHGGYLGHGCTGYHAPVACCGVGYAPPVATTGCTGMMVGGYPGAYGAPGPYGPQPVVMPPAPAPKTSEVPKKSSD
jgi:hypothetical protein